MQILPLILAHVALAVYIILGEGLIFPARLGDELEGEGEEAAELCGVIMDDCYKRGELGCL